MTYVPRLPAPIMTRSDSDAAKANADAPAMTQGAPLRSRQRARFARHSISRAPGSPAHVIETAAPERATVEPHEAAGWDGADETPSTSALGLL